MMHDDTHGRYSVRVRRVAWLFLTIATAAGIGPVDAARVFMIGNSVTDSVNYGQFQQLAQSRGHTHIWGRHIILGSPLDNIWANPDSGYYSDPFGYYPNAFGEYDWDAITLQTYDRNMTQDMAAFSKFLELARQRPYTAQNGEFFTFARWPRQTRGDYATYWVLPSDGTEARSETADYFEDFTVQLREKYPDVSIRMIPVGHVFYELDARMRAGLVPNYTGVYADFYSDGVHQTDDGRYVCALTFFATIYKEDPRGLPTVGFALQDPAAATLFQEVVWEIVTRTPLSGVSSDQGLTITTTRLPRGSVNRAYATTLRALFGTEPYGWSVSEGVLPNGLTLTTAGLLAGTPTAAGDFPVTLRVQDAAGLVSTAPTTLTITINTIPDITVTTLPGGFQGTPYNYTVPVVLGDTPLTWSLASGSLPLGLHLDSSGRLWGTPGATGSYNITLTVNDDDYPPDSDTQAFTLVIAAPEANTETIPRVLQEPLLDGVPDETFWAFNRQASMAALGSTHNVVKYAAAWDIYHLYLAARVEDATPHEGEVTVENNDSIEFLIDANHDRETVYNVDDRRYVVDLEGTLFEPFGRATGVRAAAARTANGYTVEMSIPWDNLGRTPYPGMGVGFDFINNDNQDGTGRTAILTWNGSNPQEPAPVTFGNLLLSGTFTGPVGGDVLIAYEPFGGPAGPLHLSGVPLGWRTPWTVQNNRTVGYEITDVSLLAYGQHRTYGELLTVGQRATGGRDYVSSGRNLDVTGAFSAFAASGAIGKSGTRLFASWLVRPDSGGAPCAVTLSSGGIDWASSATDAKVRLQGKKNASNQYNWHLKVAGLEESDLGITAMAGQTYLAVVELVFDVSSTVNFYLDPQTLGGEPPDAPTATFTTTTDLNFNHIVWNPGASPGSGSLDEIRIGSSYAAVTPVKNLPPIIDVAPASALGRLGQSVEFGVSAFSRSPITYQWFRNSQPIAGANDETLTIGAIGPEDFASYTVRIANSAGVTLSPEANLTRNPHPTDGYAAWVNEISWSSNSDALSDADPDQDGWSNLSEYLFGLDPLRPTANQIQPVVIHYVSDSAVVIVFGPLRLDSDLLLSVEASNDFTVWESPPPSAILEVIPTEGRPGFESRQISMPMDSLSPTIFLRLRAVTP